MAQDMELAGLQAHLQQAGAKWPGLPLYQHFLHSKDESVWALFPQKDNRRSRRESKPRKPNMRLFRPRPEVPQAQLLPILPRLTGQM